MPQLNWHYLNAFSKSGVNSVEAGCWLKLENGWISAGARLQYSPTITCLAIAKARDHYLQQYHFAHSFKYAR